jgi:hypothetical protein
VIPSKDCPATGRQPPPAQAMGHPPRAPATSRPPAALHRRHGSAYVQLSGGTALTGGVPGPSSYDGANAAATGKGGEPSQLHARSAHLR